MHILKIVPAFFKQTISLLTVAPELLRCHPFVLATDAGSQTLAEVATAVSVSLSSFTEVNAMAFYNKSLANCRDGYLL